MQRASSARSDRGAGVRDRVCSRRCGGYRAERLERGGVARLSHAPLSIGHGQTIRNPTRGGDERGRGYRGGGVVLEIGPLGYQGAILASWR